MEHYSSFNELIKTVSIYFEQIYFKQYLAQTNLFCLK